jgi:hypothetical protein
MSGRKIWIYEGAEEIPVGFDGVLVIGLIHGMIYLALIPPWQHYDEPTHFEYTWLAANWRRIPQSGEYDPEMSWEVAQSMIEHGCLEIGNAWCGLQLER